MLFVGECTKWRPFIHAGQHIVITNLCNTRMFPRSPRERFILVASPLTKNAPAVITVTTEISSHSVQNTVDCVSLNNLIPQWIAHQDTVPVITYTGTITSRTQVALKLYLHLKLVQECLLTLDGRVKVFLQHYFTWGRLFGDVMRCNTSGESA